MDEKNLVVTETEETEPEETVETTEECMEEEGTAISGLLQLLSIGMAIGAGGVFLASKVKSKIDSKVKEKRKTAEIDFLQKHAPEGFVVLEVDGKPTYVQTQTIIENAPKKDKETKDESAEADA